MLDCISVENMRLSDAFTIANFVSGLELMRRAADGIFRAVHWFGKTAIVVGSGNNGGDGFALACILHAHSLPCSVFTISDRFSDDSLHYKNFAEQAGVSVLPIEEASLSEFDIVVDCLLGTGFQGVLRDRYWDAIHNINDSGAYVVSADINSGMNGDNGGAQLAVHSDLTVAIGYIKNGMVSPSAGAYMKKLVCADIGIRILKTENKICSETEWAEMWNDDPSSLCMDAVFCDDRFYFRCPKWLDMQIIHGV